MEKLKIVFCSLIVALLSGCGGGSGVMEDSMKIKTECESVNVSFEILKETDNKGPNDLIIVWSSIKIANLWFC